MPESNNLTLKEAADAVGLSQGRISQLIHGYDQKNRGHRHHPRLVEGVHWCHEKRGNRVRTVITPLGVEYLRMMKNESVQ